MGTQTVATLCNEGDIGQRDCVQGSQQALMSKWLIRRRGHVPDKGVHGAMGVWLVSAQSQLLVQFHTTDPHSR